MCVCEWVLVESSVEMGIAGFDVSLMCVSSWCLWDRASTWGMAGLDV